MAGTNAKRAKKALLDGLRLVFAGTPTTHEVTVTYGYRGHEHFRELVHATRAFGQQSYPVSMGGADEFPRDEQLTVKLHIMVNVPGGDQEEAEDRATEIGAVVETWIAATAELPDFEAGEITSVGITAVDLDSDADDDGAIAVLTYDVGVDTRLD